MYLWPVTFTLLPLLNVLARARPPAHSGTSGGTTTPADIGIWIGLALVLGLSKVAQIASSVTVLLVKRHAPTLSAPVSTGSVSGTRNGIGSGTRLGSGSVLGKSNGLVQFAMCLGNTIGPVVVSTLFTVMNGSTWARRWGVGPAWAVIMVGLAVVGARLSDRIR